MLAVGTGGSVKGLLMKQALRLGYGAMSSNRRCQILREAREWNETRVASLWTPVPTPGSQRGV